VTVVMTTSGQVRGELAGGVSRFLSIPYATPVRFAAPDPAPVWDGVRDATTPGATAPQPERKFPGLDLAPIVGFGWRRGDEYLTADVWTPAPEAKGSPVLVFLHGGAFVAGSGSAPVYDGTGFARAGTVLVTINYRLGVEGFLPLSGGATNIGLRDQLAALRWVHENAAAFGGDPGNVTVFGESAGAISVACLLGSPLSEGLFRGAIVQSGHADMVREPAQAEILAEKVAADLGVAATAEAFRTVPLDEVLAVQNGLKAPDLRDAQGIDPSFGLSPFLPVLGDDVLPVHPSDAIAAGAGGAVDLIVGTNHDEMALYLVPSGVVDAVDEAKAVAMLAVSHPDPVAVLEAHGLRDGRSAGEALIAAMTDLVFRAPARRLAARHTGRTYCYEFDWRSPRFDGRLGACHGLELPFVFDTVDVAAGLVGADAPRAVVNLMHQAWIRFADNGDPGWPEYTRDRRVLHVDVTAEVRVD
jgi:para-nitrobenzyl esterase